jgi:hypothetical protein
MTDLHAAPATPDRAPRHVPALLLARCLLLEALDRLDLARGVEVVSLVDLRRACALSRQAFDNALQSLRRDCVLSCQGAEGRGGVSPAERAAGLPEGDRLLLYVCRRRP